MILCLYRDYLSDAEKANESAIESEAIASTWFADGRMDMEKAKEMFGGN